MILPISYNNQFTYFLFLNERIPNEGDKFNYAGIQFVVKSKGDIYTNSLCASAIGNGIFNTGLTDAMRACGLSYWF